MIYPLKLSIELVPSTSWYNNMRSLMPKSKWDVLRRKVYAGFGHKCGICKANGNLHCHEVWEYDDEKYIQKLKGFIPLCMYCHSVKHIGMSGILANSSNLDLEALIAHFMKINGCDKITFINHRTESFLIWAERSKHEWTLSISETIIDF
ncbi:MAG: HNH endonuclease [Patescibacteria group bacterium]